MSRSERLNAVMKRAVARSDEKEVGKLTNDVTIKPYRRNIERFCNWAKELGITRYHHINEFGYTPTTLIQKYADHLVSTCLKATSIHTYLAPVCKGLGICMSEIAKPRRLSKDIVKNTKLHQNAAGARQMNDPANARLCKLAEFVPVRPQAMVKLAAVNIRVDENGDHIVVIRDKGGKLSIQILLPHEVARVRHLLSTDAEGRPLKPGERPFSTKDLQQIAWSKFRIERAQHIEEYFEARFNAWKTMPSKTLEDRKRRAEAKAAAEREKKEWIDKIVAKYMKEHPKDTKEKVDAYRQRLENPAPISIRGGNRERAIALGRPTEYDRVAVRIASVYALSHWVDESTIRNYLTK